MSVTVCNVFYQRVELLAISLETDDAWLHTTLGDIKIEVFCEAIPKTSEVCSTMEIVYRAC